MSLNDENPNIFADDWRDCLAAHYMHVVRTEDHITRPTLTRILQDAGFEDAELNELSIRATMRAEDMPDGFVPDMDILDHTHEHHDHAADEEATIYALGEIPEQLDDPEPDAIELTADEALLEDINNPDDLDITIPQADDAEDDINAGQLSLF